METENTNQTTRRKCSICQHDKLENINRLVFDGKPFRAVSRQIVGDDSMRESIRRHTEYCLKTDIQAVIKEKRIATAIDVYEEFAEILGDTKRVHKACVDWLTNPNSGEIDLTPRSYELDVTYYDLNDLTKNDEPKRKTATLQSLLERAESKLNISVALTESKTADTRKLVLDTAKQTESLIDKFGKLQGVYKSAEQNVNVNISADKTLNAVKVYLIALTDLYNRANNLPTAEQAEAFAQILARREELIEKIAVKFGVEHRQLLEAVNK